MLAGIVLAVTFSAMLLAARGESRLRLLIVGYPFRSDSIRMKRPPALQVGTVRESPAPFPFACESPIMPSAAAVTS